MACPYAITEDGFESQFAVNHLGPFLFTNLIRSRILASSSPRVVNVSSGGHRFTDVLYDDPGFSKGEKYNLWTACEKALRKSVMQTDETLTDGQSKTANILFAVGLKERWGVEAFSLHPGSTPPVCLFTSKTGTDRASIPSDLNKSLPLDNV